MSHTMRFEVTPVNGHYLVSSAETGAMSLFTPAEYVVFTCLQNVAEKDKPKLIRGILTSLKCNPDKIEGFTDVFLRKLNQQGWTRKDFQDQDPQMLQMVYFSITTHCNLSCSYCYIGDDRRRPDHQMNYDDAVVILKKIKHFNPSARITVTGGEPFTHPDIFSILDLLEELNLKFTIGTNAVLISESFAERLGNYHSLVYIQASLDGWTPEIHSITRGNSYQQTITGIKNLISHRAPFAISPTIHERNSHEMIDIARFAISNGGFFAPNHLRKFPHAPQVQQISLKSESLRKCIIETFEQIHKEFPKDAQPETLNDSRCESMSASRCKYVCGNGCYTVDINWNGDVYPCHLLREPGFILGNILREGFETILEKGKKSQTRTKSYQIPKCRTCPFVSTCAGGCRASAWYNHGTFAAEDEFCDILYKFEVDKLFLGKGIHYQS